MLEQRLIQASSAKDRPCFSVLDTKKIWVENLLPQEVPQDKRDHIYNALSNLMHTCTEEEFQLRYKNLLESYSLHANVQ